ncbi:hypothetical protein [Neisseria lactamica]
MSGFRFFGFRAIPKPSFPQKQKNQKQQTEIPPFPQKQKIKNSKLKYRHSRAGGNPDLSARKLIG